MTDTDPPAPLGLAELRDVIGDPEGHLRPQYQPIIDRNGGIVAVEALARWRDSNPDRRHSDVHFMEKIEQGGAGMTLTNAMVAESFAALHRWHAAGHGSLTLSLNVFVGDLGHIADTVAAAAAALGLPSKKITVEIKGDASQQRVADTVRRLHHDGIGAVIDHFGADRADLGWLAIVPFDGIKLDQWLISGIHRNPRNRAVVRHLVGLADELGMHVTACGLEHPAEVACVTDLGVHRYQGFGIAGASTDGIISDLLADGMPRLG